MNPFTDRCATPKPVKGSLLLARRAAKSAIKAHEDAEKKAVRLRDGGRCRWPGCRDKSRLEVAHLDDKGMGGDHGVRTDRAYMICLCYLCHQGPHSLHQQTKRIEVLTAQGTNGPCAFYERDRELGTWTHVHTERER